MEKKVDILILGGSLAGALTALRFQTVKPGLSLNLLETSGRLGGEHTWTFHESDLPPGAIDSLKPIISKTWDRTTVQFPKMEKTVEGRFHLVRAKDFRDYLQEKIGSTLALNKIVEQVTESSAILANGDRYQADLVIDAREGLERPRPGSCGWHKYLSFDLELENFHALTAPVLIDATCPQIDGFRYFTLLPLSDRVVTVRETYYSDGPDLNTERITRSIEAYAERRGWKVVKRENEEKSCLAVPMTSDYLKTSGPGEAIPIGEHGGYFHATTTNFFPDAVKVAEFLASVPESQTPAVREAFTKFRRPWLSRQRFYRVLNRFLFFASEPSLRYLVLQNLFEQPTDVVSRYTGGRTSWGDRLRILSGRPALPLELTVKSLSERAIVTRTNEADQP